MQKSNLLQQKKKYRKGKDYSKQYEQQQQKQQQRVYRAKKEL